MREGYGAFQSAQHLYEKREGSGSLTNESGSGRTKNSEHGCFLNYIHNNGVAKHELNCMQLATARMQLAACCSKYRSRLQFTTLSVCNKEIFVVFGDTYYQIKDCVIK
jgi:hypothetical protein